jgi:hypothetical protein
MEQLASIPRKFLALLGMVDPYPDITIVAKYWHDCDRMT